MTLDRSPQFEAALAAMQGDQPFVFITGRAGTGKSTLLEFFRLNTGKQCVFVAPTGVAALNITGETIHSCFKFSPSVTLTDARKSGAKQGKNPLIRALQSLVIDEISMVRADLLDCMDVFLRTARKDARPFGGVQVIAIGDLYQLPPVMRREDKEEFLKMYGSAYFFGAHVMGELHRGGGITFLELETIYRQNDKDFIDLLNAVRNKAVTPEHLKLLNAREVDDLPKKTIIVTPTNAAAKVINDTHLAAIGSMPKFFSAKLSGKFEPKDTPTDEVLELKVGARVMFVANDTTGGQFVNGTLGTIVSIHDNIVDVQIDEGELIEVTNHTWTMYKSVYDEDAKSLKQESVGNFSQIPLKLAWAVTIHKSQGKTFDRVHIDMGRGAFAAGQTYVALSRCRTLGGITLSKPVTHRDIQLDREIVDFIKRLKFGEQAISSADKIAIISRALSEKKQVSLTYLKANEEKTERIVTPQKLGPQEIKGNWYTALVAHCLLRGEQRVFNVERIVAVKILEDEVH